MLQERNHPCRHRNKLLRRNVHIVDLFRFHLEEFAPFPCGDTLVGEGAILIDRVVGLGDNECLLLIRCDVFDLVADLPFFNLAIWCFNESKFIDPRVGTHRIDESDVRSLWSLNRADSSVV